VGERYKRWRDASVIYVTLVVALLKYAQDFYHQLENLPQVFLFLDLIMQDGKVGSCSRVHKGSRNHCMEPSISFRGKSDRGACWRGGR
jgi:hypothetical protein